MELGLHVIDWAAGRLGPRGATLPFHGVYQDEEWAAGLARESDGRPCLPPIPHLEFQAPEGQPFNLDPETGRKPGTRRNLKPR